MPEPWRSSWTGSLAPHTWSGVLASLAAMTPWDSAQIVKRGRWLYAGSRSLEVRIVRQESWYGTGDDEDPLESRDDRDVECFRVLFETADGGEPHFAGGGQHLTVDDAIRAVEALVGATLKWND